MNQKLARTAIPHLLRNMLIASLVVFSITTYAGQAVTTGPVVLYSDNNGAAFTYVIQSTGGHDSHRVIKKAVSEAEINAIKAAGFDVSLLTTASSPGRRSTQAANVHAYGLVSSIPSSFTILRLYGQSYGNIWTSGTRPSNATTQFLAFDFQSYGYDGIGEHTAISLFLDESALEVPDPDKRIVGNGMLIGDTHLTSGGCTSPVYNSQIEAFWATGNYLYSDSCETTAFQDGPTYSIQMQANTGGWVAYGTNLDTPPAIYTLNQRPSWDPDQGGVLFAATNFNSYGGDYTLHFSNVSTGWF